MKNPPHRLRLDSDVEAEVKTIAAATGLSQIEIIRQMVRAGVAAIKANNYELKLPLRLGVIEGQKEKAAGYPPHREETSRTEDAPRRGKKENSV